MNKEILGKRILITGDVNTGKTTLARNIMNELCNGGLSSRIVVLDMAPEIPEEIAVAKGIRGVGGKLTPTGWDDVIYLTVKTLPPRLTSTNEEEALLKAQKNKEGIDGLFEEFQRTGRDILFINDTSIYLHAGHAEDLLRWTGQASTIIANAYYGKTLGTGLLSERETAEMEILIKAFPYHIRMPYVTLEEVLNAGVP